MRVGVVVVAAGSGTRLGAGVPKAFAGLDGLTVLDCALAGIAEWDAIGALVVVAPAERVDDAERAVRRALRDRLAASREVAVAVVAGGSSRQESVARGLAALSPSDIVLVHDAARALAPAALFDRVAAEVAASGDGVVPVLPIRDTIKRVHGDVVLGTVDREELVAVQTPQGFPREVLERAYAAAEREATDDAALVSAIGHPVRTIDGDERAFKITTPADLARAEALLRGSGELRTGIGVDVHAFAEGVPLRLGGVDWPGSPVGLAGHSDGDAACHAIVDALLQAAGLGDIGTAFGTADPRYAGASGATFIRETAARVAGAGWTIRGVSVEIVANEPRIAPRREEIERVLTDLVGAPVTVAGTTSDGLGLTGSGRGVAAIATALLAR